MATYQSSGGNILAHGSVNAGNLSPGHSTSVPLNIPTQYCVDGPINIQVTPFCAPVTNPDEHGHPSKQHPVLAITVSLGQSSPYTAYVLNVSTAPAIDIELMWVVVGGGSRSGHHEKQIL